MRDRRGKTALNSRSFEPLQVGKVAGWLRLAASTINAGEYDTVVDVLNAGNPTNQAGVNRKPAASTANNGLPVMVFDGTDVLVWPLNNAINNMATKLGFWLWFKPASVASVQRLVTLANGPASAEKWHIYANNRTITTELYINNTTGRTFASGNVLTAGTWTSVYLQYDSSRGGDPNYALYTDGILRSTTPGSIGGAGAAALTVMPQPTGNAIIGGFSNIDAVIQPIASGGQLGPNLFTFNDNLTAGQIASLQSFEAPT